MTATLVPKLVIAGADRAIDFYRRALGAELTVRYTASDGTVVFSELRVGDATFDVKDEDPTDQAATSLGGAAVVLTLNVTDADAVADRMLAAGATVVFPVDDMPYGSRQGRVADPFGYQWIISQRREDLSPEQVQQRLDAWA